VSFEGEQRALLSCDVSSDGLTVATGTELKQDDALILYWDPRHPAAPLRKQTSTHSDDITAVNFSRTSGRQRDLLSGSTDGLVCISNAEEADEDEAVMYVGNLGSSIAQAGWMPRTGVWAASHMETFSLWSDEARNNTCRPPNPLSESFSLTGFPSSSSILKTIWTSVLPPSTPWSARG